MAKNTPLPDWTNELTLKFLDIYSKHPILYDSTHPDNRNRGQCWKAWDSVSKQLPERVPIEILKKKKESLMATYRGVTYKIKSSEKVGEIYKPSWFAFEVMDTFLGKMTSERKSVKQSMKSDPDDITIDTKWDSSCDSYVLEELKPDINISEIPAENEASADEDHELILNSPQNPSSFKRKATLIGNGYHPEKRQLFDDDDDECGLYLRLLAVKLKAMNNRNKKILMNKIDNIIFQMEMEEMDPLTNHIQSSTTME